MHKLCRQVSIESPGPILKDFVFNFVVAVPDTPAYGARIRVVYAGACYLRQRSSSVSSVSSISSDLNELMNQQLAGSPQPCSIPQPSHCGIRDGALFPGYEVAGIIEEFGVGVESLPDNELRIGQRVVLYPFDEVPNGYAEYIVVPELKYLIPVPDNMSLSVAAMLPTGALLAMNAVFEAQEIISQLLKERDEEHKQSPDSTPESKVKILIVGTGGLALWAVRIASHYFHQLETLKRVEITVASLHDEGFVLAKEIEK